MDARQSTRCTAFAEGRIVAAGAPEMVWRRLCKAGLNASAQVFDDETAHVLEFERMDQPADAPRGPGRPKLGVVAREVTLLPRHWDWLNAQPGGASVALRKLIEEARRLTVDTDRERTAREVTYRFLSAIAGNQPGFEEAVRGLFAGDSAKFEAEMAAWPEDIRTHALRLSSGPVAGTGE